MPIEFAPPSPNLQPFNVGAPQASDPLQTLYQIGQLRAQNMQGQAAALGLQQARMQMNSNQALLTAMAQGGTYDEIMERARKSGQVLPADLYKTAQDYMGLQKERLALDTAQQADVAKKMDEYEAMLVDEKGEPRVASPQDVNAANLEAKRRGLFNFPGNVSFTPLDPNITDPTHVKAYVSGLKAHSALMKERETGATIAAKEAEKGKYEAETTKLGTETAKNQREQMIFDLQTAPMDPQTGTVAPAADAALRKNYPNQQFPPQITKEWIDKTVRATVPAEKQPEYDFRTQNGVIGTDQFQTIFLPAYAQNLGKKTVKDLTPAERMAAFTVFKQYDTNPEALQSLLQSRALTAAMHNLTMQNVQFQQGQHSYQFHTTELDKVAKPIEDTVARFGRLRDTIGQNTPQADALVAPELMTVMAGGAGSGVRMNEAEISRVVGGRSKWEDLKAAINKWNLDPKAATSITPEQRRQIHALMDEVGAKLAQRQQIITDARNGLMNSNDPMEHRKILAGAKEKLAAIDTPGLTGATGAPKATHRYNPATGKIEVIQDGGQNR